jgi:hypothetical protein
MAVFLDRSVSKQKHKEQCCHAGDIWNVTSLKHLFLEHRTDLFPSCGFNRLQSLAQRGFRNSQRKRACLAFSK